MSFYEFTETFNLQIPDLEDQLTSFSESEFQKNHGLIIEVAAIHAGTTANYNNYPKEALEASLNTWLAPYPKPIIMNHDLSVDPVGRVMGAKMDKEEDGTPYVRLQVGIVDPEAIKKVADGRYLTGSVGGKAEEALCSICRTDWAKPSEGGGVFPCKHRKGKVYNGKVATLEMQNLSFKEYSFVNTPADSNSSVRKVGVEESEAADDDWVKPARFFVLDMTSEGIVEYTESEQRDVLEDMKKKDASPLYLGLKGAFLSALAISEAEKEELYSKESDFIVYTDTNNFSNSTNEVELAMSTENDTEQVDDILEVSEALSADLEDATEDNVEDTSDEELTDAEEESEETVDEESTEDATDEESEESEEETAETDEDSEEVEEEQAPEGQEKPSGDVDPDDSTGAPPSRESEDEEESDEETEEAVEEAADDAELNDDDTESVEPLVEELTSEIASLKEENKRLRVALHRTLAERVVDAKIALGALAVEARKDAIDDHVGRTASSLADALKDLASMPGFAPSNKGISDLELSQESEVVGNEGNTTTIGVEETDQEEEESHPLTTAEDLFVDIFTGRKRVNS